MLQVVRYDYYAELSQGNRVRIEPLPAQRGLILDRNGEVLAENRPAFQLELVREHVPDVDATLKGLVDIGVLQEDDLDDTRAPDPLAPQLRERADPAAPHRRGDRALRRASLRIPGRRHRDAPHALLSARRARRARARLRGRDQRSDAMLEKDRPRRSTRAPRSSASSASKRRTKKELHGTDGFARNPGERRRAARSTAGHAQGGPAGDQAGRRPRRDHGHRPAHAARRGRGARRSARRRRRDRPQQRRRARARVSTPGFDPNPFTRGLTRAEYGALNDNIDVPLLNRALRGQYPSGSTIKPGLALAGLVYHDVDPNATKFCPGIWRLPGSSLAFREGRTGRHGAMDLRHAIAKSCDVYFYGLANDIGVDHIAEFLAPLGFGSLTGIDIGGEKPGLLPSKEWKRKTFKRPADQVWYPGETVNFGVGQGYFLVTPLQLAHYTSILANRGTSYKPRLVIGVRDPADGRRSSASRP